VAPAVGTRASEPSSALTNRIDKGFGGNPIDGLAKVAQGGFLSYIMAL
jgi:hypothetical protein